MSDGESEKKLVIDTSFFTAYQCSHEAPLIRVARQDREWMDNANKRFPYRCLPMVVCNSFGWDVINPCGFVATWNGGTGPADVKIEFPAGKKSLIPQAHFGSGVLTFTLGHLFKTPHGVNLYVKGPSNQPKDGIIPLEGIVETDFSPATFTMNYLFTRKNHEVHFEAGEPYCRFFPIPRYMTESFEPEIHLLEENPALCELHMSWRQERDQFNKGLKIPGSEYVERGWQKDYFQGGGSLFPKFDAHQTRLRQPEFRDCRPEGSRRDLTPDTRVRRMVLHTKDGRPFTIFVTSLEKSDANQT